MPNWTLEVDYPDGLERASFGSREQAVEDAIAVINDYSDAVRVRLIDADSGACE
jgi:hypothetical protein